MDMGINITSYFTFQHYHWNICSPNLCNEIANVIGSTEKLASYVLGASSQCSVFWHLQYWGILQWNSFCILMNFVAYVLLSRGKYF